MEEVRQKRKNPFVVAFVIALVVFVALPLAVISVSSFGRISADSVMVEPFGAYFRIPSVVRTADRILAHESLPDLLADPAFAQAAPVVSSLRDSGLTENALVRLLGKGSLDGIVLDGGKILVAYDLGVAAPLMALAPILGGKIPVKNLYYVQSGDASRFEYRTEGASTWYIDATRNLLVASNDPALLDRALDQGRRAAEGDGDVGLPLPQESLDAGIPAPSAGPGEISPDAGKLARRLGTDDYDVGILLDSRSALASLAAADDSVRSVLDRVRLSDTVALTVRIRARQLDLALKSRVAASDPDLAAILARDSSRADAVESLPATAQYATMIVGMEPRALLASLRYSSPQSVGDSIDRVDRVSQTALGMGLDRLVFSWAGDGVAVFGLEGRPRPVFAIKVADERARKETFEAAIATLAISEDNTFVLDGLRIPRLTLPDFLSAFLGIFRVSVPAPYYLVRDGWLYLSESPENLLEIANARNSGKTLGKVDAWKSLSSATDERATMTLYYSLDRAIPFFLKGRGRLSRALQLYREGLARLSIDGGEATVSLSVIPGTGGGVFPLPGYPVNIGGRGSSVVARTPRKGASPRIAAVVDGSRVIAFDPVSLARFEYSADSRVWCLPVVGASQGETDDPAFWVVTEGGEVTLLDGDLRPLSGFPVRVSGKPSSPPLAESARVLVPVSDGGLVSVDLLGATVAIPLPFPEPLRAPPASSRTNGQTRFVAYPKGFSGMVWLMDDAFMPLPGWPAGEGGIGFGSPVFCPADKRVFVAFLAQSGELSLFDESGKAVSGFPVRLPGVFFFQPAFDGENLWAVSSSGVLYRIALDGAVLNQQIPDFTAESGAVVCADANGDRIPEIFVSGDGNALFAYGRDFASLDGFPLPISGAPAIGDLNGDGNVECAGIGLDDRLYCWQFRKKRGN
jgi:hypothetical protein